LSFQLTINTLCCCELGLNSLLYSLSDTKRRVFSLLGALSRRASHDVVNSQNHLCRFGRRNQCLFFDSQALGNAESTHVVDFALKHINACVCVAISDLSTQVSHEFSGVIATVLANDSG